jgi:hypothetical protein
MEALAPWRRSKGVAVEPLFISVAEFGRLFSISKSKASEMVLAGRVESTMIDGRRVVPIEEVRRFAAELRERAGVAVAV